MRISDWSSDVCSSDLDDDRRYLVEHFSVPRETMGRLSDYATLLVEWQARMNLVGPATLPHLWARHFLDSAQLLDHAPGRPIDWLDLGSGAGFPGLVIALRSEERRVGRECVSTCRSRWW